MKRFVVLLSITGMLVLGLTIAASSGDLPPAKGGDFWTYITKIDPYQKWETYPGYPGIYPGKSPHGKYLKLFANPAAQKALKEGRPMPEGAIIIKENYGKDQKTLMAITPMYKVNGYNPDGGDWFWAKYGPNGKVMASGKPKGCIKCHGVNKDSDWLFTRPK